MSAFVCVLERSGGVVDAGDLARLAAPLESYGTELATFCRGPVGIALRHRAGPAVRRRQGPVEDSVSGRVVAVAGRFAPVAGQPGGIEEGTAGRGAPAALARQSGDIGDFLSTVSGAFVVLVAHPGIGSIEVARDHLGSCKVYYWLDRDRLIAASEPIAILRHGAVSGDLDETSIARFLGFRFGLSEHSFFRGIQELPPAHRLRVTASEARAQRYWRFRQAPPDSRKAEEVTAAYRRRLSRAISADVAGLEPQEVALSLSGGLDSTALAALAPRGVRAFSWTFDEMPAADERTRIEQVSRHLKIPVRWVPGDGLHPLCGDFADRFVNENSPYLNPFAALKQRLYQAARAEGCRRVLVGDGGDTLFAASEYWLRDSLLAGDPWALWSLVNAVGRAVRGDHFARRALGRTLPFSRPLKMREHPASWLTDAGRGLLGEERLSPILPPGGDGRRHELAVGVRQSELESEEQRLFARCGVQRGNPFWSWPLLELTIHLSAQWYHRDSRSKVLTREALRGLLPQEVLEGGRTGLLGDLYLRGLELHRQQLRESVFRRPRSDWPRYVRREWLEPFLSATQSITFGHTILWRVIAYELWYRRLLGERYGLSPPSSRHPETPPPGRHEARAPGHDGQDADVAGFAYGVAIRGRLPESFQPYLRRPPRHRARTGDSLDVSYRRVDELPQMEEIWVSQQEAGEGSSGGRFALVRQNGGFGLSVSDQGRGLFSFSRNKIEIVWTAEGTDAPHYFFTYVLPLWLEWQGVPVLHASAVSIGDQAVGFLGPSGVGKSVLAAHLARLGFGWLADDGVVLRREGKSAWRLSSGPPLLRLWPSALRLLEVAADGLPRVHETLEKRQLSLPGEWGGAPKGKTDSQAESVRLAALYVLERCQDGAEPVTIAKVAAGQALVRLIEHSVAAAPAAVLGLSGRRFETLADVVEKVPVRRLCFPGGHGSAAGVRKAILNDLEIPG